MPAPRTTSADALDRAVAELRRSNDTLRDGVEILHAAIFGRPNPDPALRLPGMQENISRIKEQLDDQDLRIKDHLDDQDERMKEQMGESAKAAGEAAKQIERIAKKVDRLRFGMMGGMGALMIILAILDVIVRQHVAGLP